VPGGVPRFLKACASALALDAAQAMNTGAERKAARAISRVQGRSSEMIVLLLFVLITVGVPAIAEAVIRPSDNLLSRSKDEFLELPVVTAFSEWRHDFTSWIAESVVTAADTIRVGAEENLLGIIRRFLHVLWQLIKDILNGMRR